MDENFEYAEGIPPTRHPGFLVLSAGMITSILTLTLLFLLSQAAPDINVMGWYASRIIPVGAILVGLIAGSGYGAGSWLTGSKIGKVLMFQVVFLQVVCFFLAQYVEFLHFRELLPPGMGFWEYFDSVTRAFAWGNRGQPGEPFGVWGYAMRALECAGFALGGLIVPGILFAVPYCDRCQVYMKTLDLSRLPAGIVPRKIKKKDTAGQEAYDKEQQEALEEGNKLVESLQAAVAADDPHQFLEILRPYAGRKREMEKLTSRTAVILQHCRGCQSGQLVFKLTAGHGEHTEVLNVQQVDVAGDFVIQLLHNHGSL